MAHVRKRDGRVVPFNRKKIAEAIFKAARAVGGDDRPLAEELADVVALFLRKHHGGQTPGIEEIQDMVEKILIETGHAKTAKAYILYRQKRAEMREQAVVVRRKQAAVDATDRLLLVEGRAVEERMPWDRRRISEALQREANVSSDVADEIAAIVEKRIMRSGLTRISTSIVRALVDNELFERGLTRKLERQAILGVPKFDLDQLLFNKANENSNITANSPEAVNLSIAENVLKQYALQEVFSADVADAHATGMVHLHDLGYPTRVYCSSHSLEYIKKYGLHLDNLEVSSAPARHASTLTGHLNTFLASMQAYYAGALGVAFINVMYSPFVEGMSDEEMRQEAQYLVFSSSQNAFSRGGQTLFLDFNVHTGIPRYLHDVPAIGPGGKYTGRTYGDYVRPAMRFTRAMLDVWRAGDEYGRVFPFPKCDFHVSDDTFDDPEQKRILEYACEVASENGSPYFIFDRDEVTLSACCRLRTKVEDPYMIKHPESMRFCGFQNVTINLPQCAYRAGRGNVNGLHEEIERAMNIAMKAHLQKKTFIRKMMSAPGMPLWQVGRPAADGRPYIDLRDSTYIVGLIGLNECVHYLTGEELHQSHDALLLGLKAVSFMYFKAKDLGRKYGLRISLEESPAESAARRLAKLDLQEFPEAQDHVRGSVDGDTPYYTNSIHLRADAPVDLITRIRKQARFHPMIESGAILHAFVGERHPSPPSVLNLVRKVHRTTQAAQMAISPEFTNCSVCNRSSSGLQDVCAYCRARNLEGVSIPPEPKGVTKDVEGQFARLLAREIERTG